MATVYQAFDERLNRTVAVKVLDPLRGADRELRVRFESEARAAAAITHPNVVAVHDVGVEGDLLFIVMEWLPGRTLADEIASRPLVVERVLGILRDVVSGLGAAHAKGVLHRDIKPSNVLLAEDGRAKLADFGIATVGVGDITQTGVVIGSPAYLAPERVAGARATVRSDIYAVGVVAYEALAGVRPFAGESQLALAHAITEGRPRPLAELRPDAPRPLCDLVMRSMARDPDRRPRDTAELARLLDARATATQPVKSDVTGATTATAPSPEPTEPTTRMATIRQPARNAGRRGFSRRWIAMVLIGSVVIGLLAGGAWSLLRPDRSASPSPPAATSTPSTPQPSVPAPLEAPFDRLEQAVSP
jgi:non-specific serine/threonine protein kinase/serine/threonine-protein kinase